MVTGHAHGTARYAYEGGTVFAEDTQGSCGGNGNGKRVEEEATRRTREGEKGSKLPDAKFFATNQRGDN